MSEKRKKMEIEKENTLKKKSFRIVWDKYP